MILRGLSDLKNHVSIYACLLCDLEIDLFAASMLKSSTHTHAQTHILLKYKYKPTYRAVHTRLCQTSQYY